MMFNIHTYICMHTYVRKEKENKQIGQMFTIGEEYIGIYYTIVSAFL